MLKKIALVSIFCLAVSVPICSADISLKELVDKVQAGQLKIQDMYAESTTKITSNLQLSGEKGKAQSMVQKGKMWTKGKDKSKIEMLSPNRQITITNGDKMAMINTETGQKIIQDLKKMREKSGQSSDGGQMNLEKAMKYFDMTVQKTPDGQYILTGVPKEKNKFLGKMEFYIDASRWIPFKVLMYDPKDRLVNQSEIEYKEFSGIWVPYKNKSEVNTPAGKMNVEMELSNIKVNQGINDKEFAIE